MPILQKYVRIAMNWELRMLQNGLPIYSKVCKYEQKGYYECDINNDGFGRVTLLI